METKGNTFMNAVVGGVVSLVLVVLPLSPAIGGAVAGYLQGESRLDGAKAGTLVGLFVAVPLFVVVATGVPILVIAPAGLTTIPLNPLVYVLLVLGATLAYALACGVIGGSVGAYLRQSASETTAAEFSEPDS